MKFLEHIFINYDFPVQSKKRVKKMSSECDSDSAEHLSPDQKYKIYVQERP